MKQLVVSGICTMWLAGSQAAFAEALTFIGACDASAAIVSTNGEIAVADDEDDVIRLYNIGGGQPTREVSLESHLSQKKPRKEADLEGSAAIGEHIYWIGSHSRDSEAKREVERRALFATDRNLKPVGTAYGSLLDALLDGDEAWKVGLTDAIGDIDEDAFCPEPDKPPCPAPERYGLSIEGLGYLPAAQDGSRQAAVLIGVRNPLGPEGKALVLPLLNVQDIVMEQATPRFGKPIQLSLDRFSPEGKPVEGLRVRDLAWSEALGAMLVLGGTKDDTPDFRLYRWSGKPGEEAHELRSIPELNPEALVVIDEQQILLLSDDGDRMLPSTEQDCEKGFDEGQCPCKQLTDSSRKQFRGILLTIE